MSAWFVLKFMIHHMAWYFHIQIENFVNICNYVNPKQRQ